MKCRLLQLISVVLLSTALKAQPLLETHFSRIRGLKSNVVYCVTQDRAGYIWLGTDAGVYRYDGYEFISFTTADGLSDNEVFQIKEDDRGRIWFLTYNGRLSYYEQGRVYDAETKPFLQPIRAGSMSAGLLQQGDSLFYYSRNKAYFFVRDSLKATWSAEDLFYDPETSFAEVIFFQDTFRLISNRGIFTPATGQKVLFPTNSVALPAIKAVSLADNLYFYSRRDIYVYNYSSRKFSQYALPVGESINSWHYRHRDSSLLVVTPQSIYQFLPEQGRFNRLFRDSVPFSGFIYEDGQSNIWIGSQNQGLWLHRSSPSHLYLPQTKLQTREAYSLGKWNDRVYAGYLNNEYFVWEKGRARWQQLTPLTGLNKTYGFATINNLFFALSGNRLVNLGSGRSFFFPGSIKCLTILNDTAYVALSYNVLALPITDLFKEEKALQNYEKLPKAIFNKRAYSLQTVSDTVWIGSDEGLYYFTSHSGSRPWDSDLPALKRKINRISSNHASQLWISTAGAGVVLRDRATWQVVDMNNGLASNNSHGLYIENDSTAWVSTDKGISRVVASWKSGKWSPEVKNFSAKDGLPSEIINDILLKDDTIWMATSNGVVFIKEEQLIQRPAPTVLITRISVNGNPRAHSGTLLLTHTENSIQLDFNAVNFSLPPNHDYAYRLEGSDTSWNFTHGRRIQYSNLGPGMYRFLVTADNPYQIDASFTEIRFQIQAVFWKRPLFIILAALFLLLLFATAMRARIAHINRKNKREQATLTLSKEKAVLEQKAAAMQMNPHFLFNALNAIKGYYGSGNREAGDSYTSQFAGLMRLILEKNSQPLISLRDEVDLLRRFLELASAQHPDKFAYQINLARELAQMDQIHFPPMLIQPFVENAIVHGLGPLNRGGKVDINFALYNNRLQCVVSDNGVGLQKSATINKFRLHESKGIAITRQRLQLYSERTSLDIEERLDKNGLVTGTDVTIRFPITYKKIVHAGSINR